MATTTIALPDLPDWLRHAVPEAKNLGSRKLEDIAIAAGDALIALDALVRRLRRRFDHLVELGAVRELTGRAAFRIYGI